jgi:hypothetical protein
VAQLVGEGEAVSSEAVQHLKLVNVDGVEAVREETIDVEIPLEVRKRDDIELKSKLDNLLDRDWWVKGGVMLLKETRRDLFESFGRQETRKCQREPPTSLSVCPRVR